MIVFDVIVNGHKVDTLRPMAVRIRELKEFIDQQFQMLIEQYGSDVYLSRRFEY